MMGRHFSGSTYFETEQCCSCGMEFAMTQDFTERRLKDREPFYCPSGHKQHYTGETKEQKLQRELDQKTRMLDVAKADAATAKRERDHITKAHVTMRKRVMNGVCPCCNRTFQNLMAHMKTEHPEFREAITLAGLRKAFAMNQADVAKECGVTQMHISLYERQKPVAGYAKTRIEGWMTDHQAKDAA